jgi:hypothetical protein
MASLTCGDCATGQTGCTYGCGTVVNCSNGDKCQCLICNTCCIAIME